MDASEEPDGAHRMGGRFVERRLARAGEQAEIAVALSAERVSAIVSTAATLADRLEALPVHDDLDLRRDRQQRVKRLRWAVAAGEESLRRQAQRRQTERRDQSGAADATG